MGLGPVFIPHCTSIVPVQICLYRYIIVDTHRLSDHTCFLLLLSIIYVLFSVEFPVNNNKPIFLKATQLDQLASQNGFSPCFMPSGLTPFSLGSVDLDGQSFCVVRGVGLPVGCICLPNFAEIGRTHQVSGYFSSICQPSSLAVTVKVPGGNDLCLDCVSLTSAWSAST